MILTGKEIRRYCINSNVTIGNPGLISNYINFEEQIQPAGFDLTLRCVEKVVGEGELKVGSKKLPNREVLYGQEYVILEENSCYILSCNEELHMPENISAFGYPRSTLARMGVILQSPTVDPGYNGRLEFTIRTSRPIKLYKDVRFAMIVFHKHSPTFKYNGQYQEHGVNK